MVSLVFGKVSRVQKNRLFWILVILCSIIPDADVIAFKFGIPYEHTFCHRGFSHSIFFAFLLAICIMLLFYRKHPRFTKSWWSLLFLFFIIGVSHSVLDALTNGGLGVAFFAPFSNQRYFFAFRPIAVAPLHLSRFFSEAGFNVLMNEIIWVWIPCVILSSIVVLIRRRWIPGIHPKE
jgi:inner membrane protein